MALTLPEILPLLWQGLVVLWNLFTFWISLFISPVYPKLHIDLLWIIIPIWLNFIITEIYQEKRGMTFGSAIQNGLVAALVGVDWMRSLTRTITSGTPLIDAVFNITFALSFLVFFFGAFVVYVGIKGKGITKRIGRIRWVTYLLVVFTPAVYGLVPLNGDYFVAIILYYPLFYALVNMINRRIPTPDYN